MRNLKGIKSSSITFSSNIDSDEVTKVLPNKGRRLTIVTPSTAVVPRRLSIFPSTTARPKQTDKTNAAFSENNSKRILSSLGSQNTESHNSFLPRTHSSSHLRMKTSFDSSKNDGDESNGESVNVINHVKQKRENGEQQGNLHNLLIGRGKPLHLPLPTSNIPLQNNPTHLKRIENAISNVSHSISVVSVKYSLSGPGISNKEERRVDTSARIDVPLSTSLEDQNSTTMVKPNHKDSLEITESGTHTLPVSSLITSNETAARKYNENKNRASDIDERDGKSIRNEKNIAITSTSGLSKHSNLGKNTKENNEVEAIEEIKPILEKINNPQISAVLPSQDTRSSEKHHSISNRKVIIHLPNNQNYSIKLGSPKHSLMLTNKDQHVQDGDKISIKTRRLKLPKSSPIIRINYDGDILPHERSSSLTHILDDGLDGKKSQTKVKSDIKETFLPTPHTSTKSKSSTKDYDRSYLSLIAEKKNDELSNSSEEVSNISTRAFINIKNSNSSRIIGDEDEHKETHQQGSKLGFNNDRIHSSVKLPKEIKQQKYIDGVSGNKGISQSHTEIRNEDELEEHAIPNNNNTQAKLEAIMTGTGPRVEKETFNASSFIFASAPLNKEGERKNVLVNDVKHINVIQTKNSTYGSSENVDLNDKQSNDDRQLDSRKEPMLEVSTVQYLSNNTESGIDNYSDRSGNETIKKGNAVNRKDAKEIFQTSPSVRDYYGRGHIGVGDNVRNGQNSNKKLLNTQTESNTNTTITTTKYTQEKFDLDYEEYSDDTSFFGSSESSDDEVIPSQYEDAATYHEILVGAAQDPRYEHDEYVQETEYAGKQREFFPLNPGDQSNFIGNEEYPERKKRPHIEINAVVGISVGAFIFILLGTCKYISFFLIYHFSSHYSNYLVFI